MVLENWTKSVGTEDPKPCRGRRSGRARPRRRPHAPACYGGGLWPGLGGTDVARPSFRKEVIQPQVLLQLPCYDFTPIMNHTVVTCPPEGLARPLLVQPTFVM
jgi:hypothetical protein